MSILQRRIHGPPTCFYCHSRVVPYPKNKNNFVCPECSCYNRFDERGTIIGEEPAMRAESMNESSFAKRASPDKNRLPPSYVEPPFCHTCRTNQALLINLLSNYLPVETDPTYDSRLQSLPIYKQTLQERYPPACEQCQPMVDEEIRKKDFMAQTRALGVAAAQTRRMENQHRRRVKRNREIWTWRLRGLLWILTLGVSFTTAISSFLNRQSQFHSLVLRWLPFLPILHILSLFWIYWDPAWLSVRKAELSGGVAKVKGRQIYIKCQSILWISRIIFTSIIAGYWKWIMPVPATVSTLQSSGFMMVVGEVLLQTISFFSLSIERPAPIRLISASARNTPVPSERSAFNPPPYPRSQSAPADSDALFSTLSLSRGPSLLRPSFGQPSLPNSVPPSTPESNTMDWTPANRINESAVPGQEEKYTPVMEREGWMRNPTFFAPEKPTGLEELLEGTSLGPVQMNNKPNPRGARNRLPRATMKSGNAAFLHRPTNELKVKLLFAGLGGASLSFAVGSLIYWKQYL